MLEGATSAAPDPDGTRLNLPHRTTRSIPMAGDKVVPECLNIHMVCALFGEQVKKAREIQELKLMKLGAFNKINTGVCIFLLKSVHGHTDRSEQTIIDETVKVRVQQPRPSAEEDDPKIKKFSDTGATVII